MQMDNDILLGLVISTMLYCTAAQQIKTENCVVNGVCKSPPHFTCVKVVKEVTRSCSANLQLGLNLCRHAE